MVVSEKRIRKETEKNIYLAWLREAKANQFAYIIYPEPARRACIATCCYGTSRLKPALYPGMGTDSNERTGNAGPKTRRKENRPKKNRKIIHHATPSNR